MEYPLTWFDRWLLVDERHGVARKTGEWIRATGAYPRLIFDDAGKIDAGEWRGGGYPFTAPWAEFVCGDGDAAVCVMREERMLLIWPVNNGHEIYGFLANRRAAGGVTVSLFCLDILDALDYRVVLQKAHDDPRTDQAVVTEISALCAWAELAVLRSMASVSAARHGAKTAKLKPWLIRPPHYVAIDFATASEKHGMPRGPVDERHRPTPHNRRGNFATLRAERFGDNIGKRVWRKPAWIGPKEWEYSGQIYRVVEPT